MDDFETHPAGTAERIEQLEQMLGAYLIEVMSLGFELCEVKPALTRANAATAAAYEVAAREVECGCGAGPCQDTTNCSAEDASAIRALATPDQTAALDKLIAEAVGPLLIAAKSGLRFIENTESELGIILGCGDSLRNAILAASKKGGV